MHYLSGKCNLNRSRDPLKWVKVINELIRSGKWEAEEQKVDTGKANKKRARNAV